MATEIDFKIVDRMLVDMEDCARSQDSWWPSDAVERMLGVDGLESEITKGYEHFLETNGLAFRPNPNDSYVMAITALGRTVLKHGGWENYQENLKVESEEKKAMEIEAHIATLQSARWTKYSGIAAWTALVLSISTAASSIYYQNTSSELERKIKTLERQIHLLQSKENHTEKSVQVKPILKPNLPDQ